MLTPDLLTVVARIDLDPIAVEDPLDVMESTVAWTSVEFTEPGRYAVRLLYNGRIAEEFTLRVVEAT